jgi:hypothetical protein
MSIHTQPNVNNFDVKMTSLRTPPSQTLLILEANQENGYDNGIVLFDANLSPLKPRSLGSHAPCGGWKPDVF